MVKKVFIDFKLKNIDFAVYASLWYTRLESNQRHIASELEKLRAISFMIQDIVLFCLSYSRILCVFFIFFAIRIDFCPVRVYIGCRFFGCIFKFSGVDSHLATQICVNTKKFVIHF